MLSCLLILACGLALLLVSTTLNAQSAEVQRVGTLADDRLKEASGIIASRRFRGVFWTHDDGDDGILYAIRRDGTLIGCAKIDAKLKDWEDISIDNDRHLYVADTGNNDGDRKSVVIHRVREPDPATLKTKKPRKIDPIDRWKVDFPKASADIESLFVWEDAGYLITKVPKHGSADLFRFELKGKKKSTMKKVLTVPVITDRITAAALRADGKELAVLTRKGLWIFPVKGDITQLPATKVIRVRMPHVQNEGCCFTTDEILVVSEGREIFSVRRKAHR